MATENFISKADQAKIVDAIEKAELNTSGEIRVHIEGTCKEENPLDRAVYVFNKLNMHKTQERNGVLIYLAYKSRKFAIIGDTGINSKVPSDFWDEVKGVILTNLKSGEVACGLSSAIEMAGNKLKEFFPYKKDDVNEQSNEISFGE